MTTFLDKPVTYRNPWYRPSMCGRPLEYGPEFYETDVAPVEYEGGYKVYHRVRSTQPIEAGADVFDVVKNGVCLTQFAGPNAAAKWIAAIWADERIT